VARTRKGVKYSDCITMLHQKQTRKLISLYIIVVLNRKQIKANKRNTEALFYNPVPGEHNWTTLFWGGGGGRKKIRGTGLPGWGSLEFETIKYGLSPAGLGPENDCAVEDQQHL
jgi:hypothetical protein